jgi:hypothetical protein
VKVVVMLAEVPEPNVNEPPLTDVRVLLAPLKLRLPDPLKALTTDEPETVTVPADRVPTLRLPAKVETPLPARVSIFTVAVESANPSVPLFATVPNEPAVSEKALLPKLAVPLVMVRLLPPARSVPTVKLPLLSVNAPL